MDLKLRRGEGVFILNGVRLPWDTVLDKIGGAINFTPRSNAERQMLNAYDTTAAGVGSEAGPHFTGAIIFSNYTDF